MSSNTPRGDISLKYRFRVNGTAFWIGLRAAQRSPDTWKTLLSNGSEIVEIGVFVDITPGATPKAAEPIVGLDGKQLMACFTSTGLKWSDGVIRGCVPIPSTYEVRAAHQRKSSRKALNHPFRNVLIMSRKA